jgi:hypothetical protein
MFAFRNSASNALFMRCFFESVLAKCPLPFPYVGNKALSKKAEAEICAKFAMSLSSL